MRKALTIGELLITMTVIGVIAVLVLPSLIKDYHSKIYTTKLKKVYETLTDAMDRACIDNNVTYFNQTSYVAGGADNFNAQMKFIKKYFRLYHRGNTGSFAGSYRTINGSDNNGSAAAITGTQAKLQGGEALALSCETTSLCTVIVDINASSGPNIGGRDLFIFKIDTTKNTIIDEGADCGSDNIGTGCLARIIQDNWTMKY